MSPHDPPPTDVPAADSKATVAPEAAPVPPPSPLVTLRDYELLAELGRGGMGVVYKARHLALARVVAVKMIRAGQLAGPDDLARFRTEAQAIAALKHAHIVQIHHVGELDDRPYLILEYCPGGLDRRLASGPLPPREAAALVEKVARGVHAAHEARIVHRDLKPANVLLTEEGEPKVTDFGLAKRLDQPGLTQSGEIMGTPSYMAPEQALGLTRAIGPAADVYALGAILYECLTGRPPFAAATVGETLMQVISDDPPAPHSLNRAVPRDLETIALKCLEKDTERRYGSALALAEDLRRWAAGETIQARPPGVVERGVKWARRHPAGAMAAMAAAVVTSTVLIAALVLWRWNVELRRARRHVAEEAATRRYEAALTEARSNPAVGLLLLGEALEEAEGLGLDDLARRARWQIGAWAQEVPALVQVHPTGHRVWASGFGRDGRVTTVGNDAAVSIWGGRNSVVVEGDVGNVSAVACSADGSRVAVFDVDRGEVRTRDAATGKALFAIAARQPEQVVALAFHPTDHSLAVADGSQVRLFTAGGREDGAALEHDGQVECLAYSPDGQRLATATADGAVTVWQLAERNKPLARSAPPHAGANAVAFSPDSATLATAEKDGPVRLWAIAGASLARGRPLPHPAVVNALAFSPDGQWLATGDSGGALALWELADREPARRHVAWCPGDISHVAFHPDGAHLLAGAGTDSARLWRLPIPRYLPHGGGVAALAFSADGQRLLAGGGDAAQVWDLATGRADGPPRRCDGPVTAVGFTAPSRWPVAATAEGAHAWPGGVRVDLRRPGAVRLGLAFAPSADVVLVGGFDHQATFWAPGARRQTAARRPGLKQAHEDQEVSVAAFGPDGRSAVTLDGKWNGYVWDAGTGELQQALPRSHGNRVRVTAYTGDGRRFVTGCEGGRVYVWDAATWGLLYDPLEVSRGERGVQPAVTCLAIDPAGRLLAAGCASTRTAHVYDLETGRELTRRKHDAAVIAAAFLRDGRLLVTLSRDDKLRYWEVESWELLGQPLAHRRGASCAAVVSRPEAERVATGSEDGARVWAVPRFEAGGVKEVRRRLERLCGVRLEGRHHEPAPLEAAEWAK